MKNKNILLDNSFLFAIWPAILGFISQNIVTLAFLVIIWASGNSLMLFLEMLVSRVNQLIFFSIIFGALAIIIFGFGLVFSRNYNPLSIPIRPIRSLREIKNYRDASDREDELYFKYLIPTLMLLVGLLFFVVPYLSGVEWQEAILNSILALIPFHLGFLTMYLMLIGLETVLLLIRFTIHR